MAIRKPIFIPDPNADSVLDRLFISALAAILLLRLYLYLAGWPQVGGKGLHIAHELWGGALMLVSIVLLVAFTDRTARGLAAVLGGAGFGIFIDEIGKFITSNTNYFYRPAVSVMYVVFVLLYFAVRALARIAPSSPEEYVVSALHELQAEYLGEDPAQSHAHVEQDLDKAGGGRVVEQLRVLNQEFLARSTPATTTAWWERWWARLQSALRDLLRTPIFRRAMVCLLIVQGILSFAEASPFVLNTLLHYGSSDLEAGVQHLSFAEEASLISVGASDVLILLGILTLRISAERAYRFFKGAILVSIYITQVFLFDLIQFWALIGFGADVLILAAVNTALATRVGIARHPSPKALSVEREQT